MRTVVTLLALALPAGSVLTQSAVLPNVARAAADGITAARLATDLAYLSSDALRGRLSPSPGFDSAAAYIARRLAAAGVKPLGDDGTYFRHYDLRDESVDTTGAYLEIGGRRFRFGDDFVLRTFAGPLTGTYSVVYVGHGWTMSGRNIDPFAGVDVKGKLVLVHGPVALPRRVTMRQVGRVNVEATTPMTEAQRRGAAGIIMLTQHGALPRWAGMRGGSLRRLELVPGVPSAYAAAPLAAASWRFATSSRRLQAVRTRAGSPTWSGPSVRRRVAGDQRRRARAAFASVMTASCTDSAGFPSSADTETAIVFWPAVTTSSAIVSSFLSRGVGSMR